MSDRYQHLLRSGAPQTRRAVVRTVGLARCAGLVGLPTGGRPVLGQSSSSQFVPGVEDLPLPEGLIADPDASVVYDTSAGRIVQAVARAGASSAVDYRQVIAFYRRTLPQLGWQAVAANRWRREGENLHIELVADRHSLVVRFDLAPE